VTDLDRLLENWEGVYKKGLLTFWLLLLLDEKPCYPYEMSAEVGRSPLTITATTAPSTVSRRWGWWSARAGNRNSARRASITA